MNAAGQYGDEPLSSEAALHSATTLTMSRFPVSDYEFKVNQRRVEQNGVGADTASEKPRR